jgi:hypothetical protein
MPQLIPSICAMKNVTDLEPIDLISMWEIIFEKIQRYKLI